MPFSAVGHAMVTIHNNVLVINGPEIMTLLCGKNNPAYSLKNLDPRRLIDMIDKVFGEGETYCWWAPFGRMQHPR